LSRNHREIALRGTINDCGEKHPTMAIDLGDGMIGKIMSQSDCL
jgi:hypothetical protein